MFEKTRVFIIAGTLVALAATGCSKGSNTTTTTSTDTSTSAAPAAGASAGVQPTSAGGAGGSGSMAAAGSDAGASAGDAAHGKQIFTANCTQCHGATGAEGGVGPSLRNEKKSYADTVAWIKNPQPPMPKLYPSPLSEKDVQDVAAYVKSIH